MYRKLVFESVDVILGLPLKYEQLMTPSRYGTMCHFRKFCRKSNYTSTLQIVLRKGGCTKVGLRFDRS